MMNRNRREFLSDVGKGMLIAGVGSSLASELGLSTAFAADLPDRLTFGDREPLVALMQDTAADQLLPILAEKLKAGTKLDDMVAAAALANARTFGGQDYDGYHCFMALLPSLQMAKEMPKDREALPVFKVIHRNTRRMQTQGGSKKEVLKPVQPGEVAKDRNGGEVLQEITRKKDVKNAESTIAAFAQGPIGEAYNHLQYSIQDEVDVHRVVLAWRAWASLDVVGKEHAATLLRQSVRFCVAEGRGAQKSGIQIELPKLLDQYKLLGKPLGDRKADDATLEKLAMAIYSGNRSAAAEAAAAALAEGFAPDVIGEAISLASNRLVLGDPGRIKKHAQPGKPEGSIHGASVGVHASDSANAWRSIAKVTNARNTVASLIVGAYHTGGQSTEQHKEVFPQAVHLEKISSKDADTLLRETDEAIKANDQARAAGLIHRYGELGHQPKAVFDLMLKYACSEDGALHAEKYYRTVTEEFATSRPAFRWRHLVALARVTASEHGYPSPGFTESCKLLKV